MASQVVELLRPCLALGVTVDATFGGGGHTRALLAADRSARVLGIDRDPDAAAQAAGIRRRFDFRAADFRRLGRVLEKEGIDEIAGALFDLGVSSHQLDVGERGFSYHRSGPLDMRMGPDAPQDAAAVVNGWDRDRLADALLRYGEERHARRIADAVVAARPIHDTAHLARVVADAMPARSRRSGHPARRTFQALRIAVNDELGALAEGLDVALRLLRPGGRLVVISYHSLEDRIVKRRLAAGATGCVCPPDLPVCGCGRSAELRLLTRKALRPDPAEVSANPRSRSARLRAAERTAA
ncbi:MAG: 16S rRNA (cytosine(1402)-N(4))-methyltransferase RsmH [Actinobacteria bacterium]|nr:16S rRNA (cytosine(1402)-N(4))-methyltransferase RsmH [Actinomycetota bacterium]